MFTFIWLLLGIPTCVFIVYMNVSLDDKAKLVKKSFKLKHLLLSILIGSILGWISTIIISLLVLIFFIFHELPRLSIFKKIKNEFISLFNKPIL